MCNKSSLFILHFHNFKRNNVMTRLFCWKFSNFKSSLWSCRCCEGDNLDTFNYLPSRQLESCLPLPFPLQPKIKCLLNACKKTFRHLFRRLAQLSLQKKVPEKMPKSYVRLGQCCLKMGSINDDTFRARLFLGITRLVLRLKSIY